MKPLNLLPALLLAMTLTITISCKKDKDDDNGGKTKTELLTAGPWKITGFTTNPGEDWDGDGDLETNIYDYLEACEKDSYTTFATNGTGETNEGPTKCDAMDPQSEPLIWSFADNESKLVINFEELTLIELTASVLKLRSTFVDVGVTYTQEFTFGH